MGPLGLRLDGSVIKSLLVGFPIYMAGLVAVSCCFGFHIFRSSTYCDLILGVTVMGGGSTKVELIDIWILFPYYASCIAF
ncbi:hypothetical protein ACJX0J_036445, partial [Zea mays]